MNKIFTLIISLATAALTAAAGIHVSDFEFDRSPRRVGIAMDLDLSSFNIGRDRQLMIIPVLHNADSTISHEFQPVYVAGRNIYYQHLRNDDMPEGATLLRTSALAAPLHYTGEMPAADWVDDSQMSLYYRIGGCCDRLVEEGIVRVALIRPAVVPAFKPQFNFLTPIGDQVKTRELKKSAYVDFPLDKIVIYPDYRRNSIELPKIIATIDSVRGDSDVTIDAIFIKGFASPEGRYDHNTWLAKNRTQALKQYVDNLYKFAPGFIRTDYESEDWAGLRRFVESSNLEHREQILAIIDSDLEPDTKDNTIRSRFPAEYRFLLDNIYPGLRHSDYKIDYTIRSYTSLDDIFRVMTYDPSKLSVSEFYRAAESKEPGSPEYDNILLTAVRIYPDDPVANLNAANIAMRHGDLDAAADYLARADAEDPSTIYASGILAALRGQYAEARDLFTRAARLQVADAPAAIDQIDHILDVKNQIENPAPGTIYIKN